MATDHANLALLDETSLAVDFWGQIDELSFAPLGTLNDSSRIRNTDSWFFLVSSMNRLELDRPLLKGMDILANYY